MPMTAEAFAATCNVSRETLDRLRRYADMLVNWQRAVNLVAKDSLTDLWRRHMLDSAQLHSWLPDGTTSLADLGSGAGFPGLVLAILGVPQVHLIESDSRKCVFLAETARAVGLVPDVNLHIHNRRAEEITDLRVQVVTARACANLGRLLELSVPLMQPDGICLFLKGARVEEELTEAHKIWNMQVERFASLSDPSGTILRITQPTRTS